jgi:hypothetical protein
MHRGLFAAWLLIFTKPILRATKPDYRFCPARLDTMQPIGLSLCVLETRGQHIFVAGRLRHAHRLVPIKLVDVTLLGQIPMLPRPGIRRVVQCGGAGPGWACDVDFRGMLRSFLSFCIEFLLD